MTGNINTNSLVHGDEEDTVTVATIVAINSYPFVSKLKLSIVKLYIIGGDNITKSYEIMNPTADIEVAGYYPSCMLPYVLILIMNTFCLVLIRSSM